MAYYIQLTMGVTIFSLFALLVAVTTVSSLEKKMVLPTKVKSLHQQCIDKPGFDGECWTMNRIGNYPHCGSIACAASAGHGNKRPAYLFENAPDGLQCGERKICYDGHCQALPRGVSMPEQTTTNWGDYCECYVVGGKNTQRTQRN